MKYSFSCPAPCNYKISVDAKSDDEAVTKIMTEGKAHAKKAHPNMPPMTEDQMKAMVRSAMRKE